MNRCSSVDMRKNMQVADKLRISGIDFVCVPVYSQENKEAVIKQAQESFEAICIAAEAEE